MYITLYLFDIFHIVHVLNVYTEENPFLHIIVKKPFPRIRAFVYSIKIICSELFYLLLILRVINWLAIIYSKKFKIILRMSMSKLKKRLIRF